MGVAGRSGNVPDDNSPLDILKARFSGKVLEASLPLGDATVHVVPESIREIMEFLKDDSRLLFDMMVDITAVDYLNRHPRFEVVYHLLSLPFNRRLRVKVQLPAENPVLDSLSALWGNADWLEREVWDMFGVRFAGHPNLKRILMYEGFEGHPLRKDYPIRRRQPLIGPES